MSTLLTFLFTVIMMNTADQVVSMGSMEPATDANFAVEPIKYSVPEDARKIHTYMETSSRMLDRRMQNALKGIDEMSKRLLALKYYLKRRGSIKGSWAWSRAQALRYKKSGAYGRSITELVRIRKTFEELNPGYSLRANADIRGVGDQVRLWNRTASVEVSARDLLKKVLRELSDTTWPEKPDKRAMTRFHTFLSKTKVLTIPTVAVPGFSQHGQLRAFDFVILQGNQIVAGTDAGSVRSVWDVGGWATKLKEAIDATSDRFSGPLKAPYEPWHYEYSP